MQGRLGCFERLVRGTTNVPFKNSKPATNAAAFVAPNSNIIGNVVLAENSSVWYGATLRGDAGAVTIGANTTIGDRTSVSASTIGSGVTIGPNAHVHGATIGSDAFIGANAVVAKGVKVGARSIVQPGSVLVQGTVVPTGHVFAGSPAVSLRAVTDEEVDAVKELAKDGIEKAQAYAFEANKSFGDLADDEEAALEAKNLASDHWRDAEYNRILSRTGSVYNKRSTL